MAAGFRDVLSLILQWFSVSSVDVSIKPKISRITVDNYLRLNITVENYIKKPKVWVE